MFSNFIFKKCERRSEFSPEIINIVCAILHHYYIYIYIYIILLNRADVTFDLARKTPSDANSTHLRHFEVCHV